ncbi:MAG: transposase [Endomicrobium sp.]|jgi:transposase-like protein|nr:transposase [Endomicrobium sp.]
MKQFCQRSYTSAAQEVGEGKLEEFRIKWDNKYHYVGESWKRNWSEVSMFWKYSSEMRRFIYTKPQ